jgi:hypothetical protein
VRRAIVVAIGLVSARVEADPWVDAIAHHDLEGLRAQLPSPAAKCGLTIVYAQRRDLLRAALYLDGCDEATLPDAIRDDLSRALRKLRKELKDSELTELYIDTRPAGLVGEIDALPGEHFTTPITVWVPAGTHVVKAASATQTFTNSITTKRHSSGHIFLDAGRPAIAAPKPGVVVFGEGGGDVGDKQDAPPPDLKHPTLLPNKYVNGGTTGGEQIDDPLAVRENRIAPPYPPSFRVGLRVGAGAFGHSGGSRIAPSIALVTRMAAPWEAVGAYRPFELGLRIDWSRRGGDDGRFDEFAASVECDKVIAATDAAWIAIGLALRGDLVRIGTMIGALPLHGPGVSAAASIDLALRDLPIAFGVRYEQGVTELVDGIREHAILVEAGFDYRHFQYRR